MDSIFEKVPVRGEIWEHTKTGGQYTIEGACLNTITDRTDVVYRPLFVCEFDRFSRQLTGHPKAFLSLAEDGRPRFRRISASAKAGA